MNEQLYIFIIYHTNRDDIQSYFYISVMLYLLLNLIFTYLCYNFALCFGNPTNLVPVDSVTALSIPPYTPYPKKVHSL